MWIDEMRSMLQSRLPHRAFLKRDRGDGLYVTNAPVFDPEIQGISGFIITRSGNLMHILPDESWIVKVEKETPPDHLAASLLRFRGKTPNRDNLMLFAWGCKLLEEEHPVPADVEAYDRSLRRHAAMALRGVCGGGLYACALLNSMLQAKPAP